MRKIAGVQNALFVQCSSCSSHVTHQSQLQASCGLPASHQATLVILLSHIHGERVHPRTLLLLLLRAVTLHCRYWYKQWDFGWYRRYKRNYAPGWSKPNKGIYGRRLQQQQQQQNETIMIPPCLLGSQSYSNTCKQCNYTGVTASVTVNVTRSGVISQLGRNPLGLAAPGIAVTAGGSIVIVASYSGPFQHPNSTLPAYAGELTQPQGQQGLQKIVGPGLCRQRSVFLQPTSGKLVWVCSTAQP
jgi:hypothetical protein